MKEKEYPMPDDYHKFLAETLKMIEIRDHFAARLKYTAPELREEVRIQLAETDELIEKSEALLARQYEDHQKNCRDDEEWEVKMRKMERFYVYAKHRRPDMFEALASAILTYVYEHEDSDAFHDRIRILEATELDEILDDNDPDRFDF